MARYELRLDRTRRFTPAGFALGPSYSGLGGGGDLRGLKRSPPNQNRSQWWQTTIDRYVLLFARRFGQIYLDEIQHQRLLASV